MRQGFGAVGFGLTMRRQGVGGGCGGCGVLELADGIALLDVDALVSGVGLEAEGAVVDAVGSVAVAAVVVGSVVGLSVATGAMSKQGAGMPSEQAAATLSPAMALVTNTARRRRIAARSRSSSSAGGATVLANHRCRGVARPHSRSLLVEDVELVRPLDVEERVDPRRRHVG